MIMVKISFNEDRSKPQFLFEKNFMGQSILMVKERVIRYDGDGRKYSDVIETRKATWAESQALLVQCIKDFELNV